MGCSSSGQINATDAAIKEAKAETLAKLVGQSIVIMLKSADGEWQFPEARASPVLDSQYSSVQKKVL